MIFIARVSINRSWLYDYIILFTGAAPFIEKKGYLYKMGGQRKSWKLRYFVIRPGVFNYFKDSSSSKPLGEVKLKNLSIFFPGPGKQSRGHSVGS